MNLRRPKPAARPARPAQTNRLTARDLHALILIGGAAIVTQRGVEITIDGDWTLDDVLTTLADIEMLS